MPELCAKFIELFGARKVGEIQQKGACLKLYALYAPGSREAKWKKESDLPPRDLVEFQRVWDPQAPDRCLECCKAIEARASPETRRSAVGAPGLRGSHCSIACKRAGLVVTCTRCTPERKCAYCGPRAPLGSSKTDEALRENEQQLKRARQMLGHERCVADPNHEPAWKRRRRS